MKKATMRFVVLASGVAALLLSGGASRVWR